MYTNLMLYNRMSNLLNRIYPTLINFPKSEKFALTQDIKNCILEYLTYISKANSVKSMRLKYSQEAESYLIKTKTLLKLAYNLRYINEGFYKIISLELTEISKMLAGYMRSIK